jgi:hypothetical protein
VAKGRKTSEEASHTAKKRAKEGQEKAGRCHPRANFLDKKNAAQCDDLHWLRKKSRMALT